VNLILVLVVVRVLHVAVVEGRHVIVVLNIGLEDGGGLEKNLIKFFILKVKYTNKLNTFKSKLKTNAE